MRRGMRIAAEPGPTELDARLEFRYGRSFFYLRAFLLLALFTAVLLFLALQTVTPPEWIALLAALLVVYLVFVGLSPLLTHHTLMRSRLILRQGWYFRAVLPFAEAETIGPFDAEPKWGLRLSLLRRTLYVVGSGTGLVAVRLREPRRFAQVLFLRADEIVFDVGDREAFLAAVQERRAALESLPARKLRILPGPR